jgi:transcriptional antiterminator
MHCYAVSLYVAYFIIFLCLTPDDFTGKGESAATQWVKQEHILIYFCYFLGNYVLLKLLSRTLQIAQSKVANHMLLARGYPD